MTTTLSRAGRGSTLASVIIAAVALPFVAGASASAAPTDWQIFTTQNHSASFAVPGEYDIVDNSTAQTAGTPESVWFNNVAVHNPAGEEVATFADTSYIDGAIPDFENVGIVEDVVIDDTFSAISWWHQNTQDGPFIAQVSLAATGLPEGHPVEHVRLDSGMVAFHSTAREFATEAEAEAFLESADGQEALEIVSSYTFAGNLDALPDADSPTATEAPATAATPTDTSTWQTYTTPNGSASFRHPADMTVESFGEVQPFTDPQLPWFNFISIATSDDHNVLGYMDTAYADGASGAPENFGIVDTVSISDEFAVVAWWYGGDNGNPVSAQVILADADLPSGYPTETVHVSSGMVEFASIPVEFATEDEAIAYLDGGDGKLLFDIISTYQLHGNLGVIPDGVATTTLELRTEINGGDLAADTVRPNALGKAFTSHIMGPVDTTYIVADDYVLSATGAEGYVQSWSCTNQDGEMELLNDPTTVTITEGDNVVCTLHLSNTDAAAMLPETGNGPAFWISAFAALALAAGAALSLKRRLA